MNIKGSIVALVTPMNEGDGSVDYDSLQKLVEWQIEEGTDALVVAGTTGESATLGKKEQIKVIEEVVKTVNKRIPVIAGTGCHNTQETIETSFLARSAGADACLVVTPYYNKPTQKGLYLHFENIANMLADMPLILYNVPGRTACDLLPETVAKLSLLPNIIGIKEATGDLKRLPILRDKCAEDFCYYSGDDATAMEFMLQGGHGVISVTANVVPKLNHQLAAASLSGKFERAKELNRQIEILYKQLYVESNPIPVKWALHKMGKIPAGIRLPLTELSPEFHEQVTDALKAVGAL